MGLNGASRPTKFFKCWVSCVAAEPFDTTNGAFKILVVGEMFCNGGNCKKDGEGFKP